MILSCSCRTVGCLSPYFSSVSTNCCSRSKITYERLTTLALSRASSGVNSRTEIVNIFVSRTGSTVMLFFKRTTAACRRIDFVRNSPYSRALVNSASTCRFIEPDKRAAFSKWAVPTARHQRCAKTSIRSTVGWRIVAGRLRISLVRKIASSRKAFGLEQ